MALKYNPTRVEANIEPKMLIWAREESGFTQKEAAKAAQTSLKNIVNAELGASRLTYNQFRRLAKFYGRPMATFYLDSPPADFKLPDFRSNKTVGYTKAEGNIQIKIRELYEKKKFAEELYDILGSDYKYDFVNQFDLTTPASKAAKFIRNVLHASTSDLSGLSDPDLFRYWTKKIESLGILVFQFGKVDLEILRGFVFSELPFPLIALNSRDSTYAKVFTMIHEITHVILNFSGMCEPNDGMQVVVKNQELENFFDEVASLVLLPPSEFNAEIGDKTQEELEPFLIAKSREFKISYSVILVRLRKLKKIGILTFNWWLDELKYRRKSREAKEEARKNELDSGGPSYYQIIHSQISKSYMKMVVDSLNNDLISFHNAMEYVGDKHDTLKTYLEEIEGGIHKL